MEDIIHELSLAYSNTSNGVAQWFNRTIIMMRRGKLHNIPLYLWAKIFNAGVYIKIIVPYSRINELTPYDIIPGKIPSVKHHQHLGRKYYIHIVQKKRPASINVLYLQMKVFFWGTLILTKSFISTFSRSIKSSRIAKSDFPNWTQERLPLSNNHRQKPYQLLRHSFLPLNHLSIFKIKKI